MFLSGSPSIFNPKNVLMGELDKIERIFLCECLDIIYTHTFEWVGVIVFLDVNKR